MLQINASVNLLYATGTIPTNHPCLATFYGSARFGGWHHFFKLAFPPLTLTSLLTPYQFGFRKNYSTTSAILHLTCNILDSFEQNENFHTCFLDLTKAFDFVSHELLIKKLLSTIA
jgi:hypothetical protein